MLLLWLVGTVWKAAIFVVVYEISDPNITPRPLKGQVLCNNVNLPDGIILSCLTNRRIPTFGGHGRAGFDVCRSLNIPDGAKFSFETIDDQKVVRGTSRGPISHVKHSEMHCRGQDASESKQSRRDRVKPPMEKSCWKLVAIFLVRGIVG